MLELNLRVVEGLLPDRTVLVELDVETALSRVGDKRDRIERAGAAFWPVVAEAYRELAARFPERYVVVDGRLAVDVINASNAKALSVGTGSDANALPSFMETFLKVEDQAKLVVEHQVGDQVKDLFLQVNSNGSIWHINARIAIRRL